MRSLSLVKITKEWKDISPPEIFKDELFIYLGEIPNMPGHGVFIGHESGQIYSGYHIERFEEVPEDET